MVAKPKEREALSSQVRASAKGHPGVCTEFAQYVAEFNARARLRKIGFVSSFDDLTDKDAKIFLEISHLYDKIDEEHRKKSSKRR